MQMKWMTFAFIFLISLLSPFTFSSLSAQSSSTEIYKNIQKFGVLASVLYVAAHPDDENTRLISYLSNHLSANTTYLSLTRGDGGQNLIGSEIREMLGVIRTQELLAAREIDGGHQMFTRANDFGYSKSPTETFNIWGRNEILSDVVWAIRKTQPDVIINRFNTDVRRPNHGHHTASAILSVEAFDLASDPKVFPEQLQLVGTWKPRRIFYNTSWFFYGSREAFDTIDKSNMLLIDIGAYDDMTGESNSEIAGRSRSMHKSQGFGSAETRGESIDYLDLIKDTSGKMPKSLFDGIDITWNRIPGGSTLAIQAAELERTFNFKDPSASVPLLINIHKAILQLPDSYWKRIKLAECEKLIQDCLGLFIELRGTQFRTSPGSMIPVTLEAINRSGIPVILKNIIPPADPSIAFDTVLSYNQIFLQDIQIKIPDRLSIPYWLHDAQTEGLYNVSEQRLRGMPADPPSVITTIQCVVQGESINYDIPVVYRTIDPAEGEIYRPLYVTPPVTISLDDEALVFTKGKERMINMTLTAIKDSVSGLLNLSISDPGWQINPKQIPWSFMRSGETIAVGVTITPPDYSTSAIFKPEIIIGQQTFHHTVATIDYDHLPYMSVVRDASVKLKSLDIKTISRPIAYIEGAGDDVDKALEQLGYDVDKLEPGDITTTILSRYQVIILGVRAFNTLDELAYKNDALFDWVKQGGTLIVQYNTNRGLVTDQIAPYPLSLSRDRVTEENAPVSILTPEHPALNFPNKIENSDFAGWVQERGLYFPNQWDEKFTPLLQMNDTNETPTKGAILVAPYGEGYYVYTGLSWFRHLPAGVPGAYRMLSNIISLGYKNSKS